MNSSEVDKTLDLLSSAMGAVTKQNLQTVKLQAGIINSLTQVHLAIGDLLSVNRLLRDAMTAPDATAKDVIADKVDIILDDIFKNLIKSLKDLEKSNAYVTPEDGE